MREEQMPEMPQQIGGSAPRGAVRGSANVAARPTIQMFVEALEKQAYSLSSDILTLEEKLYPVLDSSENKLSTGEENPKDSPSKLVEQLAGILAFMQRLDNKVISMNERVQL